MHNKSVVDIVEMKKLNKKIVALTCYDYCFAKIIGSTDIDMILIGDSLGMVIQGHETTLPVTLEEIIYHTKCVQRANPTCLLVADLPFLSYQSSTEEAIRSSGRILKETRAQAVKLEGSKPEIIEAIVNAGIPVMGHLGLTPQSINIFGSYATRGKQKQEADKILSDAKSIEEAGCFSIVLEKIPSALSSEITDSLNIPTIGIGAGVHCDGQILVLNDMLGMNSDFKPKFVKFYAELEKTIKDAVNEYCSEVRKTEFPKQENSY
ncbi:MAG: 3-methyl-2-oxobutanoate hydroxymethyltransferase [Candidatus Coatesbacteria bacterium]|nr:3-methyl-2-oxobutanoate hydroxymethyltransferase [Candidatus Coatesbacteria bacterium]